MGVFSWVVLSAHHDGDFKEIMKISVQLEMCQ